MQPSNPGFGFSFMSPQNSSRPPQPKKAPATKVVITPQIVPSDSRMNLQQKPIADVKPAVPRDRKNFTVKSKQLPKDFASQVLNLELSIDHGDFTMDTVNELIVLYSKAIEYYNGMQDEKYAYFESRIQNLLIRPEVLQVMTHASRNPQKYEREEEKKRQ